MDFKTTKKDGYTLIEILADKLDTVIVPSLKAELVFISSNGEKNMIMDFSKCRYVDSSGLSAILVANRLCKSMDGTLVVTGLQSTVERLIVISQLDSVLNITYTVEEAQELLKSKTQEKI